MLFSLKHADNIELYTLVTLFSGKAETHPHCIT